MLCWVDLNNRCTDALLHKLANSCRIWVYKWVSEYSKLLAFRLCLQHLLLVEITRENKKLKFQSIQIFSRSRVPHLLPVNDCKKKKNQILIESKMKLIQDTNHRRAMNWRRTRRILLLNIHHRKMRPLENAHLDYLRLLSSCKNKWRHGREAQRSRNKTGGTEKWHLKLNEVQPTQTGRPWPTGSCFMPWLSLAPQSTNGPLSFVLP